MKNVPLSRAVAEKRARAAQITFAALAVGAGAVATMALPRLTEVPSLEEVRPKPVDPPTRTGAAETPTERVAVNAEGISQRLMQLANRPHRAETPVEEAPVIEDQPVDPPLAESVRFVGVIREAGRMVAIVHVGGRQRVMAEGEEVEGVKVQSIAADAITVTEGGVEKRVEKGPRSGSSITMLRGSGSEVQARVPSMGQPIPGRSPGESGGVEGRVDLPQVIHQQAARRRPNIPGIPSVGNRNREQRSPSGN